MRTQLGPRLRGDDVFGSRDDALRRYNNAMPHKIPESVLVVIHTADLEVLLIERADRPGFWQSVTGSLDRADEPLLDTAAPRTVRGNRHPCRRRDHPPARLAPVQRLRIYQTWRHRYAPGVTHNTEHVFSVCVPRDIPITLAPREHLQYAWLPLLEAADRCFSSSNAEAILHLPRHFPCINRLHVSYQRSTTEQAVPVAIWRNDSHVIVSNCDIKRGNVAVQTRREAAGPQFMRYEMNNALEESFLTGDSEMAALILARDWSATPLGPIARWPQSLRTTVSLCLASNFPINIIWGPQHTQIYNDGYRVLCGDKHPASLGMDYTECWASAWPAIGQPFERRAAADLLPGKPAHVPVPQWLSGRDLLHLFAQPDPRRKREYRRPVPPGDGNHRDHAQRTAHARCCAT